MMIECLTTGDFIDLLRVKRWVAVEFGEQKLMTLTQADLTKSRNTCRLSGIIWSTPCGGTGIAGTRVAGKRCPQKTTPEARLSPEFAVWLRVESKRRRVLPTPPFHLSRWAMVG